MSPAASPARGRSPLRSSCWGDSAVPCSCGLPLVAGFCGAEITCFQLAIPLYYAYIINCQALFTSYAAMNINVTVITYQQIRGARAMLGLTQAELGDMAGYSKTAITNIERGKSDAKGSTLRAIQK